MTQSVLHVYRTYYPDYPGGLQEAIRQIAFSTKKLGVSNKVFALSEDPSPKSVVQPEALVVRERSWLAPASCDIGGYSSFKTFKKVSSQSDVLHYHFPWPFADLLHVITKPDTPAIMTYHSDVVRQKVLGRVYQSLMYAMLKQMQVIIATSPAYVDSSPVLSLPQFRKKVRVVPLGINQATYSDAPDNNIFTRCKINLDTPYFLFLGVLRYYKGVNILLSAAKKINAQIVIAGSGPEYGALTKQVENDKATNIIFTGQVTEREKVALLKQCYSLILPSHLRSEAFGMVLVEAAMFGKPMISCEIATGTSYVNQHEETGLVVSPNSPDQLVGAMQSLLSNHKATLQMGASARKRYVEHFSGEVMGRAYRSIYEEVLNE